MGSGTPTGPARALGADLGGAYVPMDAVGGFRVLDPPRADILRRWVAELLPGDGRWPGADATDAAAYVDATAHLVPRLRGPLIRAVDRLRDLADPPGADAVATMLADDPDGVAALVLELACEGYYRHPAVVGAVARLTDYDPEVPLMGTPMPPFDPALLERVRDLPPRWRPA